MSRFVSAAGRRLPVLLLWGLLALLLWGQCSGLFYPKPPKHFLYGYVASVDSLRTQPPATLYLTLALQNKLRYPVIIQEVEGTLLFHKRTLSFSATAQLHHTPLAATTSIRQAIAIAVPLPPDSLALLRQQLQTNPRTPTAPELRWQVRYDTQNSPPAGFLRHLYSALPALPPAAKATGTGLPAPAAPR